MQRSSEPGVCRCCLGEGTFKRLAAEHRWLGEKEVYIDMLRDCFGHKVLGGNDSERLICEVCITRLRDAFNFKKQVTNSEKLFHMSIGDEHSNPASSEHTVPLAKVEVKLEAADDNYDNSTTDEFAEDFEIPVKMEKTKPDPDDPDDEPLSALSKTKPTTSQNKPKTGQKSKPKTGQTTKPARKRTEAKASTSTTLIKEKKGTPTITKLAPVIIKVDPPVIIKVEQEVGDANKNECVQCDTVFATESIREVHESHHEAFTRKSERKCPSCKILFSSDEILKHMAREHNTKPLVCEVCGIFYLTQFHLRVHTARVHEKRTRDEHTTGFPCLYCDQVFPNMIKRTNHCNVHREKVPVKCGACNKMIKSSALLKRHQRRVHLLERNHKCQVCNMGFFSTVTLRSHMLSHTGEKLFRCQICGKKVARAGTLAFHMRIHNNDKRKVCTVCGAAFVQKASLNYHMEKHHPNI